MSSPDPRPLAPVLPFNTPKPADLIITSGRSIIAAGPNSAAT